MKAFEIKKLGANKGAPRLWLEGNRPLRGGFTPGSRYNVQKDEVKKMLTLEIVQDGVRVVSKKQKGDKELPIIDINSAELLSMFAGMDAVRVVIAEGRIFVLPIATEVRRKERLDLLKATLEKNEAISVGSVSHGTGVLSFALEQGLRNTGVQSSMSFAIDIDGDALEHASNCNPVWKPDSMAIAAPLQEVVFDEHLMSKIPRVILLEAGLPCAAASLAGRAKKHLEKPEDDPNFGHLICGFVALVARVSPVFCILENVVPYQTSASMGIYRSMMNDLGYEVHERVVSGEEFGVLENRKRMVAIAVTRGIEFDLDALLTIPEITTPIKLGELLDNVPNDDPSWSEMQYLKDKEVRDIQAGKGFKMQQVCAESTSVPTITRGYMKRRSTDPFVRHPEDSRLMRLFTPAEHARIKGIPESFVEGLSGTTAHQLLGQSILTKPFIAVGEAIGKAIVHFKLQNAIRYEGQFELLAA